jgi:NADH-quinone oxidoreductase subunit J
MIDPHYPLIYVFHFYLFGVIAIASSIAFVTRKSPVSAALWLVAAMFCLSVLFVMLDAPFIGVMQVLVYAGAIMVVFLFVVMLLNLGQPAQIADARGKWGKFAAVIFGLILISEVWVLTRTDLSAPLVLPRGANEETLARLGAVGSVAKPLFNEYLLPFELTSVLLLIAIVGAVLLGRRSGDDAR